MSLYKIPTRMYSHIDDLITMNVNDHSQKMSHDLFYESTSLELSDALKMMRIRINEILSIKNDNAIVMSNYLTMNNFVDQMRLAGILSIDDSAQLYNVKSSEVRTNTMDKFVTIDELACQEKTFAKINHERIFIAIINPEMLIHQMVMNNDAWTIYNNYALLSTLSKCYRMNAKQITEMVDEKRKMLRGAVKLKRYDL